ncbi:TBC1 domain family member 5 isoform X2 [Musca domestica]|uniref:TBC1 domain family member 5 isoform X2 n=1 Tax=Musca domestica TaxID=7370 RepID=A0ABM3V667_MUSDO|nr:TBC1 domain family member 5 isoform X2 [Musca domestica]
MTVPGVEALSYTSEINGTEGEQDEANASEKSSEKGTALNSKERYRNEWSGLLKSLSTNPEYIREQAFDGALQYSKFRSVFWSILLRVLSEDHLSWALEKKKQRQSYEKLGKEFAKNPHQTGANLMQVDDDPLSQSSKSVWNQYFSDQELFATIRQDVVRTFPGVDFFRKPAIQNIMINILFYYARDHPYMSYRQGMHEILAPILFVMYGDHQSFLHFKEIANYSDIDDTLLEVMNPLYLEADSYFIFSRVMASIESYYRVRGSMVSTSGNSVALSDPDKVPAYASEVEVITQLNFIRDKILAKEDLHLHNYLIKLDIPLHIFGIRWLRLLFGREFALLDLLVLWDAIFADSDHFDLPNYVLVAMLIRIRDKLLLSDYTTCLTYLMRYPQNVDISLILRHALHMKMPKKYDRPSNAFIYFTMPGNVRDPAVKDKKCSRGPQPREKSALERHVTTIQERNAVEEALFARIKSTSEGSNNVAMDGYKDNNTEVMRLELKNMQTVVAVARSKLQSYLETIRKNTPKQSTKEMLDAIDGIEELCHFLDVKIEFPLRTRPNHIDQALEANELQYRRKSEKTEQSNLTTNHDLKNIPIADTTPNIYERPDNGMQSSILLGTEKEFELVPIVSEAIDPKNNDNNLTRGKGLPKADPLSRKND